VILEDRKEFFAGLHEEIDLLEEYFVRYEETKEQHTGRGEGDWDALEQKLARMVVKAHSVERSVNDLVRGIKAAYEFVKRTKGAMRVL